MTRILAFTVCVIAAAVGLAWFADRPGSVTVQWLGYQIETSAFVGALAIAAVVALLILLWAVLRYLFTRPAAIAAHLRERRRQQGYDALSRGLLAIGVGDRTLAQRYAGIAGRNLPREPLTALLRAQTAQLRGDRDAARRAFESMLDRPETQLLGVRGLFLEAARRNDTDAARALAEQAVKRDPRLAWGVNALFDMQARAGDYESALDTLAIARQNGHVDQNVSLRRRAVLLTAEARELEAGNPDKALNLASEALRLAPSLVPAAEIAGRVLASKGESRQASRLIARTWKLSPHPDLALVYAFAKPGEPPRERVKRVKQLASLTPGDVEGQIAIASAAIEAHEWQDARAALAPYLDDRPSARICMLMARLESGELGDKGREREWLARALRAPRDRAWIADGYISDRWLPISPVTGAVDAFEWKAPVDAIGRGDDTLIIEERPEPVAATVQVLAPFAPPRAEPARIEKREVAEVVDVSPKKERPLAVEVPPMKRPAQDAPRSTAEQRLKPAIFVPERPPDDPGVAQTETDETSPNSLERLRAAQIR
jgi:HemY protein